MLLLGKVREAESSGESRARGQQPGTGVEARGGPRVLWGRVSEGSRGLGADGSGPRPPGSPLPPPPSTRDLREPQRYTRGRWHGWFHFKMCPSGR